MTAALRDRVAELEEVVRQMRAAFAPDIAFPADWKLKFKDRAILSSLYVSRGGHVSAEALLLWVEGAETVSIDVNVRQWIAVLRAKVEPFGIAIEVRHGKGYSLTPAGRSVIARAIGDVVPEVESTPPLVVGRRTHPNGWTDAEDAILCRGYEEEATLAFIRIKLASAGHRARSLGSISVRAQSLGLTNVRRSALWSPEEDAILRKAYDAGTAITGIRLQLAQAGFVRNRSAIQMRAIAIGVSGDRVRPWTQPERAIVHAGLEAGLPYEDIRDQLRERGFERGRTAVTKMARAMGCRRSDAPWTDAEVEILRKRYVEKASQRSIAEELGRPVGGIASMASKLGLIQRVRWTAEERARLVRGFENGERLADVCRDIDRPYANVASEARRLGLRFAQARPDPVRRAA